MMNSLDTCYPCPFSKHRWRSDQPHSSLWGQNDSSPPPYYIITWSCDHNRIQLLFDWSLLISIEGISPRSAVFKYFIPILFISDMSTTDKRYIYIYPEFVLWITTTQYQKYITLCLSCWTYFARTDRKTDRRTDVAEAYQWYMGLVYTWAWWLVSPKKSTVTAPTYLSILFKSGHTKLWTAPIILDWFYDTKLEHIINTSIVEMQNLVYQHCKLFTF